MKLELNWIGKNNQTKLEPRILLEKKERSYSLTNDSSKNDNVLIYGDNLLALKALESKYVGKVKCAFIDPPYNTGGAFTHYDDGIEHSLWLSLIRHRIEAIRNLLSEDGSLWISIDDNECHYLKVLCDEIFGRSNFVSNVIWQKKYSPQNDAKWLSDNHDHILVYAKNKSIWRPNLLPRSETANNRYKNPDNDPRGPWKPADLSVKTYSANNDYEIKTPSGRIVKAAESRCWGVNQTKLKELIADNRIWFGPKGSNVPAVKKFLTEVKAGTTSMTIWTYQEVGHNQDAKKEVKAFNSTDVFDTPKPEKLLEKILRLATKEGDIVLDSFAGSGTTGAVAHKMKRKWIMVELGDHCHTHIIPRLKQVINGTDRGGISDAVDWQKGGGYKYFELAPSLLKKDQWDNWVINKEFNGEMLSEALCKLEGFTYSPSEIEWWNQGYSTEADFITVTTQNLSIEKLQQLSEAVGSDRTLLVCCTAFRCNPDQFANLTIKKIPKMVLNRCEWAHDDYSLNVQNLPMAAELEQNLDPELNNE